MIFKQGKYSNLSRFISGGLDLLIINLLAYFLPIQSISPFLFHIYISIIWIIISNKIDFYSVNRFNKVTEILNLLFRQFVFFLLSLYAFIGFFKQPNISRLNLGIFFALVFCVVFVLKFSKYVFLRNYRKRSKSDTRDVIVIGKNKKTDQLIDVFKERVEYGYIFVKQFATKNNSFNLEDCFSFIIENNIDEVYCSIEQLRETDIQALLTFANSNFKTIKFIPDNKQLFTKKLKFEYYDYVPILSLQENPLGERVNSFVKRSFDVLFSGFVILFLLSWLTPLMAVIIRLESKGPIFFRQNRKGYDFNLFTCYKFRSMAMNDNFDSQQASKNDMRVTRVGKFIRKTSMDELPQFYNVFLGDMSIVGPRPLLIKHTNDYVDKINKFMLRHHVKPGITGLAQVKGCRGEIERDIDMKNRVRFDIFYVENWSLFLDIKIITQTVLNIIRGEEKAY